jgi:hypothetical protein
MNNEIDTFLNEYKTRMIAYYTDLHAKYYALDREICQLWNSGKREESRAMRNDMANFQKVHGASNIAVIRHDFKNIDAIIDKDLAKRKEAFIKRITDKAGNVESADLRIGQDGSINGKVTGDKSTVTVNSIVAGGYNIQKAHYRVLVK